MARKGSGFSMLELLVTVAIIGVIAALAIPTALNSLQAYRIHADAADLASSLNITRMRAASQYSPYALDVDPTKVPPTWIIEQLTSTPYDPLSPAALSYASRSPQVFEGGTQYAAQGDTFAGCRPSGITAYPGQITADPSSCTGTFQVCFNTRGLPVQCSGSGAGTPMTNGGIAIYIANPAGLTDAVTVDTGGVVQVWDWDVTTTKWYQR